MVHDVQQQTMVFFSHGSFNGFFCFVFNILACTASCSGMINEARNGKG